jgi:hypothetical protein
MFTDCLLFCSPRKKKRFGLKLIGVCQLGPTTTVREFPHNPEKGLVNFLEYSDHPSSSFIMRFATDAQMKEWKAAIEALVSVQAASLTRQRQRFNDTRGRSSMSESMNSGLRAVAGSRSGALPSETSPRGPGSPPPHHSPRHLSNSHTSINPPRPQFILARAEEAHGAGAGAGGSGTATPESLSRVSGMLDLNTNEDKELSEYFGFSK